MSKKTILKGTIILTITGVATKLLGFYNRIFLTRLIGVKELGIYQLIFPIYLLAFSFCCQGIATALTKQVSYHMGKHEKQNIKKVFWLSVTISFSLALLVSVIINLFADELALSILKNSSCAELLRILTAVIPIVAVKGCINSYFVAIGRPGFHGFSHFIEQIIRIGSAMYIATLWSCNIIGAKLAVLAMVIGEISATVLAIIFLIYVNYRETKNETKKNHTRDSRKILNNGILAPFLKDAFPLTANNVMFTLFASLEAIIMPAMLFYYYNDRDMALEMFGIVNGIVFPFLLFPSTITTSLSTMLLPAVSYAHAKNESAKIQNAIKNSMLFCLFLGVFAWIGYVIFGDFACTFAFKSKEAGSLLTKMSFLCPLIYLSGTLSAILNGLDKTFKNLMFNIVSIIIRIIFSVLLVKDYGLTAYVAGMTTSYLTLNILQLNTLRKEF